MLSQLLQDSPVAQLLASAQREAVADVVNAAVQDKHSNEPTSQSKQSPVGHQLSPSLNDVLSTLSSSLIAENKQALYTV